MTFVVDRSVGPCGPAYPIGRRVDERRTNRLESSTGGRWCATTWPFFHSPDDDDDNNNNGPWAFSRVVQDM
jgi:hypothetical protein